MPKASLATWPADLPPPRLGISWREDPAEPGSVLVIRVVEGTPAAAAGLAVGDRINDLDGQPFADADDFQSRVMARLDSGRAQLSMLTERNGHLRTAVVQMASDGTGTPRVDPEPIGESP
jgi:S1-C subfamily serine protease